jgi:hypothetical protein
MGRQKRESGGGPEGDNKWFSPSDGALYERRNPSREKGVVSIYLTLLLFL